MADESAVRARPDESHLNEEHLSALVQALSTFTWISDADGNFSTPQPGWQAYTGHDFQQHGQLGWIQDVHPEDRERVSDIWRNAVCNRTWYEVEWRCWHGDSRTWRHCITRGVPLLNPGGSIRAWIGAVKDVEQERQQEVNRRDRTLAELVERAPFGIYVVDSQFRVAHMNAGSQTGTFRNVRPIVGRDLAEAMRILWPEAVADQIIGHFRRTLETGEPYYSRDFTRPRRDLETVESYEWELHRMTLPDGQPGVICYYFDSTKLREAETALRASEERLSAELAAMTALQKIGALVVHEDNFGAVLEQIVESAITIAGADFGNIQLLNPISHRLEIVAQRGFAQWFLDYWASVAEGEGSCGTALERGDRVIVVDVEQSPIFAGTPAVEIQRRAGVRAVLSIPLFSRSGAPLGMFSTHYKKPHSPDEHTLRFLDLLARHAGDIIARAQGEKALRRSEEHFRRLYESNIVGIVRADTDRIIDANDVFLEMVGYDRKDVSAGINWREITPQEHFRQDESALAELLDTGSCKPFEKELFRKDGSRVAILIGATVLDKSPLVYLAFTVDLTERKKLERRLMDKQKLEGIGLLAGGVAHDFNNLLVGILGNASLGLDMIPQSSEVRHVLQQIVKAGERAAHLTRQMLAYSGKGQFVLGLVDLSDVVREMTQLLRPTIPSNIFVHFDLARDLRPVIADAGQVQQVIMNLVVNAAEAIGEEPGSISVRTSMRSVDQRFIRRELDGGELEAGTYVSLEVRDSGCGMDQETIAKVFDPFFTTKFTGRGLGLAAVSGIIRGHKGAIHVKSAPGQGTTFLVLLPAAAEMQSAVTKEPDRSDTELRGNATILVVPELCTPPNSVPVVESATPFGAPENSALKQ